MPNRTNMPKIQKSAWAIIVLCAVLLLAMVALTAELLINDPNPKPTAIAKPTAILEPSTVVVGVTITTDLTMTFWEDFPTTGAHEVTETLDSTVTYASTSTATSDVVSVTQISQAGHGPVNHLAQIYHIMCRNFSGGNISCLLLLSNKIYHLKLEDVWSYANISKSIK